MSLQLTTFELWPYIEPAGNFIWIMALPMSVVCFQMYLTDILVKTEHGGDFCITAVSYGRLRYHRWKILLF
jgi:hypothetical protein